MATALLNKQDRTDTCAATHKTAAYFTFQSFQNPTASEGTLSIKLFLWREWQVNRERQQVILKEKRSNWCTTWGLQLRYSPSLSDWQWLIYADRLVCRRAYSSLSNDNPHATLQEQQHAHGYALTSACQAHTIPRRKLDLRILVVILCFDSRLNTLSDGGKDGQSDKENTSDRQCQHVDLHGNAKTKQRQLLCFLYSKVCFQTRPCLSIYWRPGVSSLSPRSAQLIRTYFEWRLCV